MELQVGDRVRTESGLEGKVLLVSRLTAYVEVRTGNTSTMANYLLSQLTKIENEPESPSGSEAGG